VTARLPDGAVVKGVANIGQRPTVGGVESRLEAHLFDFAADLYGQTLTIGLHHFLREEKKFGSFEELKGQILRDADQARAVLDNVSVPLNPLTP
jgi:riboflavin kinase/FMN adenylyltransferase